MISKDSEMEKNSPLPLGAVDQRCSWPSRWKSSEIYIALASSCSRSQETGLAGHVKGDVQPQAVSNASRIPSFSVVLCLRKSGNLLLISKPKRLLKPIGIMAFPPGQQVFGWKPWLRYRRGELNNCWNICDSGSLREADSLAGRLLLVASKC